MKKLHSYTRAYKKISEFRRDAVSGEWILLVEERHLRPGARDLPEPKKRKLIPKKTCLFENPQKHGSGPPILWHPHPSESASQNAKDWFVQVVANKYPAVVPHHICPKDTRYGPYLSRDGIGFHEVIITRDHERTIADMTTAEVDVLVRTYQERYVSIENEPCIKYILIFHNHGERAGASITHPHSQLIALPIIPPDVKRSLRGSEKYFQKHNTCAHCAELAFEKKQKKRIIYTNKKFTVLAPFASRVSFEIRIFPNKHASHFEVIGKEERMFLADALRVTMKKLQKGISDPDYNFFIHTAPAQSDGVDYYHWHLEILPRISTWAGVELGTGIEVVAFLPEETAGILRKIKAYYGASSA
ncbi:MAG: DUF4921 family protein [Candidatus Niyogibacteria bacterium]|nr:DUF4921 family protein [Candidatus Niyogibacteria bacterium]